MPAEFSHKTDGDGNHHISVTGLRAIVIEDDDGLWCAQGLDVDYASSGTTSDRAKEHFLKGLCYTLAAHAKAYGSLDKLFRPAPEEAWRPFYLANSIESQSEPLEDCPDLLPGFLQTVEFLQIR